MSAAGDLPSPPAAEPRKNWGAADVLTALRIPLAGLFVAFEDWRVRLAIVVAAGVSDLLDGWVARRLGPSRVGAWLDPVADKIFTVTALLAVIAADAAAQLRWGEILALVLRDVGILAAFLATRAVGRPVTIPARFSGKTVTVLQFATLASILLHAWWVRPLAWVTAAASVWAIADYAREARKRISF